MDSPTFSIRQKYGITDRKSTRQNGSKTDLSIREIINKYSKKDNETDTRV